MLKKLILLVYPLSIFSIAHADETQYINNNRGTVVTHDFSLMNNDNIRQDSSIWDRMRNDFKLSKTHDDNPRVKYYENFYTKHPASLYRLLNNAIPYLYFILTEIERNCVPGEIALIPAVESSFNPKAKNSYDKYAGMWQFIPTTGKQFNLTQNTDLDERRNIVKSTRSALLFLDYLHSKFKQWDIAIGAYNWGEGNMTNAVLNAPDQIGHINYQDLELRNITANYVPKVIALAHIIKNPEKFGITLPNAPNQPYFAIISPHADISIQKISAMSKIDDNTFSTLNPEFKKTNYILSNNDSVLIPVSNQNIYNANYDTKTTSATDLNSEDLQKNLTYADNIEIINNNEANNEVNEEKINNNTNSPTSSKLITHQSNINDLIDNIPTKASNIILATNAHSKKLVTIANNTKQKKLIHYQVEKGDTLFSISKKFSIPEYNIKKNNNITDNNIKIGTILILDLKHKNTKQLNS
ncbi:MAG: LysM peptidoglycan-binding domain-containing protein [Bacteroidia bacterium]|nr:MAG: LysM peptidoglycan-binding domain-containing protein [Bacteroidia bacterium]